MLVGLFLAIMNGIVPVRVCLTIAMIGRFRVITFNYYTNISKVNTI